MPNGAETTSSLASTGVPSRRGLRARRVIPVRYATVVRRSASGVQRSAVTGVLALVVLVGATGTGAAVPPLPNPSDGDIERSEREADAKAGEVGRLANELAEAQSRLGDLRAGVALRMEEANKALVDLRAAEDAAGRAEREARAARAEVNLALAALDEARADLDRFIAGSYQQGSTIGSIGAYLGSDSPEDLLSRAQLLNAVSGSHLDALDGMRRAQVEKSNKDAQARKTLDAARQRRSEAERARATADEAHAAAVEAQRGEAERAQTIESDLRRVEQRLYEAQQEVRGLHGQRERYEEWQARQAREQRQAQRSALAGDGGAAASGSAAPGGARVEAAIARAMTQLGVPYAWGGGTATGPSYGIRDGGVADRHGDYQKIGFDCSGLMIYAFAGAEALPHYSGYQYHAGHRVPLSQMRRGDMLFWGPSRIHHVALYLGNGQMIEAPYSGGHVRIAPVRYDGIMPYATRLMG